MTNEHVHRTASGFQFSLQDSNVEIYFRKDESTSVLDIEDARALRDWLNKAIPHEPGAFGYQDAFYQIAEVLDMSAMPISPKEAFETVMLPKLRALVEGASRAEPSESPQAPIAKIRVWAHLPPDVKLYAPGLPPGEHDVYCEPMSVAPALSASRDASSSVCTCGRQTDR